MHVTWYTELRLCHDPQRYLLKHAKCESARVTQKRTCFHRVETLRYTRSDYSGRH